MNLSVSFVFVLGVLLGVLRTADLMFGTDMATGLCTVGSVWWRYVALGIAVLAAVLAGRKAAVRAEAVRSRQKTAGVLAFAGAVCFLAAGGSQLALTIGGNTPWSSAVRIILECLCAVWLSTLGRRWLSPGAWKTPAGGLYLAVAGSLLFYWNVLMRFMENSSSWHRVTPTAAVWQELAALLLLSALARALYLPQPGNRKALCAAGLAAFVLCLCWQLPRTLLLVSNLYWTGAAGVPEVLSGFGLCCIGGIGAVCAKSCADGQT